MEIEKFEQAEKIKGDIKFDDVWFGYKEDDFVLKGISLEAKQGETIALVGSTGAGMQILVTQEALSMTAGFRFSGTRLIT